MMVHSKRAKQLTLGVIVSVTVILVGVASTLAQGRSRTALLSDPPPLFLPFVTNNGSGASGTSFELIEQALARGEIDEETALVYKVFAVYLDPRLPQRFNGNDSQVRDTLITAEAGARWPSLSPATQALLAPFLLPPAAPGSWLELQQAQAAAGIARPAAPIEWVTLKRPNGKVKVWYQTRYPGDDAVAAQILADMEDIVWPKLTGLMGRNPLPDAGLPNNGGDGLFDIYLVRIDADGEAHVYDPPCSMRPAFVLIDGATPHLRAAVVHEFMHAIIFGYKTTVCEFPEYRWLNEATATWAEDYISTVSPVYDTADSEQEYAPKFLWRPIWSLESVGESHEYGAYLWPFYLARSYQPELIRTIWEATESKDSLAAIDGAIPGGLRQQWPEFAKFNLNRVPVDIYTVWDGLAPGAAIRNPYDQDVVLPDGGERTVTLDAKAPHLAATYYRFVFSDPDVTRVRYGNAGRFVSGEEPRAKVEALIKIEGQGWTTEDWTSLVERRFCRTKPGERIEELLLIFSNSEWQNRLHVLDPGTPDPTLWFDDEPCSCDELASVQNWTGQVTFSFTTSASDADGTITYDHSATANLQMVPDYHNSSYVAWKSAALGGTGDVRDVHTESTRVTTIAGSGALYPGGEAQDDPKAMLGLSLSTCTFEFYLMTGMSAEESIVTPYDEDRYTISTGVGIMDINDIPVTQLTGSRTVPAVDDPTYSDEPSWFVPASRMDPDLWWMVGNDFGVATVNWSFAPAD